MKIGGDEHHNGNENLQRTTLRGQKGFQICQLKDSHGKALGCLCRGERKY